VGCMVLSSNRASQIEFPLPICLARRPTSHSHMTSSQRMYQGYEGVIRHKVPCDTDTPYSTCYTKYLWNSDRLWSLDIR
jgi:hypothetical protein